MTPSVAQLICAPFGLAAAFVLARMVRIADGPDEVHRNQIGKMELFKM